MTATAQPKTEPRSTAGRFSFQMCGCSLKQPHGYFHLFDGTKAGDTLFSKPDALRYLDIYVGNGEIPAGDKKEIEEDINLSTLPEMADHQDEAVESVDLQEMVKRAFGINSIPTKPFPDGTHSIIFCENKGESPAHGHIAFNNQQTAMTFNTKDHGRKIVQSGVNQGYVSKIDEEAMLKQIEKSTLPE